MEATRLLLVFALAGAICAGIPETDRLVQSCQDRVKQRPGDHSAYDALGAAYLQKARETGDADYYERAEVVLQKSLDLSSTDLAATSATIHMAQVYMGEHRFRDALDYAERALSLGSGDPTPFAIAGDAYADMGEYERADEYYAHLTSGIGGASTPLAYLYNSRVFFLKFIHGDTAASINLMRRAAQQAIRIRMPAENIAWCEFELGEMYYQSGDLRNAEAAYSAALALYPADHRALAGLARTRTAQNRYEDAIPLYEKAISVVPMPTYAAALGDVYAKLHRLKEARKQYELVEFIGRLNEAKKVPYDRELALFYADHDLKPDQAVALARKELEVRQDIYTWDVLAWALYKARKYPEAAAAMAKATALGTQDGMLLFHAGMIQNASGKPGEAAALLRRALDLNVRFHPLYAELAEKTLSQLPPKGT